MRATALYEIRGAYTFPLADECRRMAQRMAIFTVPGLKIEIEAKRYRITKTKAGTNREWGWKPLPVHESDLSTTAESPSDLAIAVLYYERFCAGPQNLRESLTKPQSNLRQPHSAPSSKSTPRNVEP